MDGRFNKDYGQVRNQLMKLKLKRLFTKLFWIFPINKNKIFFTSYEGKQYSCNPKAIYEKILSLGERYVFVWEYNKNQIPEKVKVHAKVVKHNSLKYFMQLSTSQYIITNSGISASISLRKSQMCVNTWHGGGAYKKVGIATDEKINGSTYEELKIMADHTTYFLSSSTIFTEIMSVSTLVPKTRFLNIGMPRNDIFFDPIKCQEKKEVVYKSFGILNDHKLVLIAPTYRGNSGSDSYLTEIPDISRLYKALHIRFGGKWTVLYRSHYYKKVKETFNKVLDASSYPDMQELLCACDVLITDYSSSIWDYSLLGKPCFLFVPDLREYLDERGGFYSDIETWPGYVSMDNNELEENIINFDCDEYKKKIKYHHDMLGSFEKGNASLKLLEILKI